ncbi:MAG: DUF1329 domain-containing protein [Gammaproteobacteria bacterium]|nr:DUF1329 domain-containing protein [Gammaproteobacteria bacterium]
MIRKTLFAATLAVVSASAMATATPEEAAQLGKSLTPLGAEKAGNKEGTIPEWTGGLTTPPASYKPGDTKLPDPFGNEKPRLVITGQNADQYKDKLNAITYALLKRYPTMRVDVFPTHRSIVYPDQLAQNTAKNATQAKSTEGGLSFENALPGIPFPIPKTGNEVIWNHLMRFNGVATLAKYDSYNIDSSGTATLSTSGISYQEWPLFSPENITKPIKPTDPFWLIKLEYPGPARRAGESLLVWDHVNPLAQPRKAWQYLPGQRRVKLAPDIAYDTPNPGVAGSLTYDDSFVFNGAMDRFDFKLAGKKEMFIPYNAYKAVYFPGDAKAVTTPNHFNPDLLRWELHRVWVVEATLKPGKRHVYSKRVFYCDEDSWICVLSDQYDARGQLYRGVVAPTAFNYGNRSMGISLQIGYDLVAGLYAPQGIVGLYYGIKQRDPFPPRDWQPDSLAGAGIR